MNSLILCEGRTDCIFLQNYLEKVHSWIRLSGTPFRAVDSAWANIFEKQGNLLFISETKGSTRIAEGLVTAIRRNENASPINSDDYFDRILVFTDNDEDDTQSNMFMEIQNKLSATSITFESSVKKDEWNKGKVKSIEGSKNVEIYIMFIPFSENGALETYLLNCIGKENTYDETIINKTKMFVDTIDGEARYLNQRRLKTKACFDIYFSVRTAAEQYAERKNLISLMNWEEYTTIRKDFKVFAELG